MISFNFCYCRYNQTYDSTPQKYYQDSYSHLESPEKVNSLEHQKHSSVLKSHIDNLGNATYGMTSPYGQSDYLPSMYTSFTENAPNFSPTDYTAKTYDLKPSDSYYKPTNYFDMQNSKQFSDGYSSSEYVSDSYKTPGGYKTSTFKHESYHSSPQPMYSSSSEKYYTSVPGATSPLEKKHLKHLVQYHLSQKHQLRHSKMVEHSINPHIQQMLSI